MAMIGKVLRMHHREKKSVREIVRATSLSRNTVRKYLRTPVARPPRYRRKAAATKLSAFVETVKMALLSVELGVDSEVESITDDQQRWVAAAQCRGSDQRWMKCR